jgi:2'-5' RNA ligase
MADLAGIFVIAEIGGDLAARITAVQREHDPRLAALWAPHITLLGSSGTGPILPDTSVDDLRTALAPIAERFAPIPLTFGAPYRFPDRDIVVLPLSPHGPLRTLHEALKLCGLRMYRARYPFTPHCTLTMYPPLTRERERQLAKLRFDDPFVLNRIRVVLTRTPQPARSLLELSLSGPGPD